MILMTCKVAGLDQILCIVLISKVRLICIKLNIEYLISLSFPLVGNPSDLFNIVKKDSGQAGMTNIWNCVRDRRM